jgi:DNA mismatch repair protein MutH
MLSSKKLKVLQKYIDIVESIRGKTIEEINLERGHIHYKKGASGLIIENLLGIKNNNSYKADIEEINTEIKVLPIQLHNLKAKEPTQIKMINFMEVAR